MAENDFLVWAPTATTEIYNQTDYSALPQLGPGVAPGIADAKQANKAWRQGTLMASMVASYIVDQINADVIDDGTTATILNNFKRSVRYSQRAWGATGTPNAQILTLVPPPTNLAELIGVPLNIRSIGTNTAAVTLNINGFGTHPVVFSNGNALSANSLILNSYYTVLYDGTNFQIENTLGFTPVQQGGGANQGNNKVYLGYHTATGHLSAQVDATNFGDIPWLSQPNGWSAANTFDVTAGVNQFQLRGTSPGTGANLSFVGDGAVTPNKWIRARAGVMEWINSAYSAVIATLSDLGDLTLVRNLFVGGAASVTTNLTTGGTITAGQEVHVGRVGAASAVRFTDGGGGLTGYIFRDNSANVVTISSSNTALQGLSVDGSGNTTTTGRYTATYGARGTGFGNFATLLLDFVSNYGGNGYCILPNGIIIQWGQGNTSSGYMDAVFLPLVFPSYFAAVVACESVTSGWDTGGGGQSATIYGTQRSGTNAFYISSGRVRTFAGSTSFSWDGGIAFGWIAIGF